MISGSNKDEKLNKEIEHKINIIENESYNPGPSLNKIDFSLMFIIAGICVVGLIWGGI